MEAFRCRLISAMEQQHVTQSELCAKTGIPKSAMSQYLSGSFKPRQNRTYLIAEALGVSPAWLMGYDTAPEDGSRTDTSNAPLSADERELITAYRSDPELRAAVDSLMSDRREQKSAQVFRAAHSEDGRTPPASVCLPEERLKTLRSAPETNEDF